MGYVDCEYQLMGVENHLAGRFHSVCIDCDGPVSLEEADLAALRGLEFDPAAYGKKLFDQLFPRDSELLKGYLENKAFLNGKGKSLRFRLHVVPSVPEGVGGLSWERLHDENGVLAYSSTLAFSRYLAIRAPLGVALSGRPRLLVAIAAPVDQARWGLAVVDRVKTRDTLERCFRTHLDGRIEVEFLTGPVTPRALLRHLQEKRFHALHLIAHGLPPGRRAAGLTLEDDQGLAQLVSEEDVVTIFSGDTKLRLITLLACHGSAAAPGDPYHGLAGRLVRAGVPAVVSMGREISFAAAELFSQHFYLSLAETGQVDVAVNAARRQLVVSRNKDEWDVPVLFMRLRDGRPWIPPTHFLAMLLLEKAAWASAVVAVLLFLFLFRQMVQQGVDSPSTIRTVQLLPGSSDSQLGSPFVKPAIPHTAIVPTRPRDQPARNSTCEGMLEAAKYKGAGGGNLKKSAETYERIVSELSSADRASLDPNLLARAEEQRGRGSTSEAVRLYQEYLNGLECSGPKTQSPTQ